MPGTIQPPRDGDDFAGYAGFDGDDERRRGGRKLARYAVPVAVASVAAATIGIGTALATTGGGPSLPGVTAQQLLTRIAAAKADTVSGSIRVNTDLGVPSALLNGVLGGQDQGKAGGKHGGTSAADPAAHLTQLLSGSHTLRVAVDGPTHRSLTLADAHSTYTLVRDGSQAWAYDSTQNAVEHVTGLPAAERDAALAPSVTPGAAAAQALKALGPTTAVTVDGTAEVAGRDAYELVLTPKSTGSTIGSVRVAVDAATGVPLSLTVMPSGGGDAIADIAWTQVDFTRPAASAFTFTVPKGAHVTSDSAIGHAHGDASGHAGAHARHEGGALPGPLSGLTSGGGATKVVGTGWTAVAELQAPQHHGAKGKADDAAGFLATLGKPVKGAFGSGTVISTRVVNVLITDDGGVYAGAVTPATLEKAADAAK